MNKKEETKKKAVKCWEVFRCNENECPAYNSKNLKCWLFSGTHCRNEIQGHFLEKMEMCLGCKVFKTNMNVSAMKKTLGVVDNQFKQFRNIVEDRDRELEGMSMELALGLSEVFEALKKIATGDPSARVQETSSVELIAKLKHLLNITAENIGEIVNQSHEFAIDLAEHFDVLHRVSKGDLVARVMGGSQMELSESLKKVTNEMIESIAREIIERKRAENDVRESEKKWRNIIEHSNELFYIHDTNHTLIFASPQSKELLGYTHDEMMTEWTNLTTENPVNQAGIEITEKAIKTGERQKPYLLELYRKDREKILLEIDESPLKDEEGNVIGIVGAARDVTEYKEAEEALKRSEERYRSFVKNFQGIAYRGKFDFTPVFMHGAVEQITGYTDEELVSGKPTWDRIIYPDDLPTLTGKDELRTIPDYSIEREYRIIRKDGQMRWVYEVVRNVCDNSGRPFRIEGAIYDITERKQAEEQILYMAYHDPLTNMPNRHLLKDRLSQAIASARQYDRIVAILFLDLDHFKHINDTLGHDAGDKLLQSVAYRIRKCMRKSDTISRLGKEEETTIARLGGDEFTLLLTEVKHIQDAAKVAQRILNVFSKPFSIKKKDVFISTSIGISLYPHDGEDAEILLKNADTAMYYAKNQGRNNFQFYTESMNIAAIERFEIENELRKALERDEFVLYYQPQLDILSGNIIGVEALVRWIHPGKGLIPPNTFIPLAEDTGLIVPIGKWILYTACAQNKAWQEAGLPPVYVTVNISGIEFRQKNFVENVAQTLHRTGLDPQCLELELIERVLMEQTEATMNTLNALKAMGIRLSIDDFGIGYSSLSYLKLFPLNTLKIDRSFVRDLITDPNDRAIINAIIALAHSLNLNVIAEGVETQQQFLSLREQGSDGVQGFLFSPPVPIDELTKLLREEKILSI